MRMYFFNSARSNSVTNFPDLTSSTSVRSQNLNLSEIHTLGSRTLNILTANFNRQRTPRLTSMHTSTTSPGILAFREFRPVRWTGACR